MAAVPCSTCVPWWHIDSGSAPSTLAPGGEGKITLLAENLGDASADAPVVIADKLPAGVTAQGVELYTQFTFIAGGKEVAEELCTFTAREVTCAIPQPKAEEQIPAYGFVEINISVKVAADAASGVANSATISGGGASSASVSRPVTVSSEPVPFGIERYELRAENADGSPDTQAGSHPFELTTDIAINQTANSAVPPAAVKDLRFNLPPGLIGNPTLFPQCPVAKFQANAQEGQDFCPDDTVVGVASITVNAGGDGLSTREVPLFSLVPSVGEPARFGFYDLNVAVFLNTSVRTGSDYGVTVTVPNITELANFVSSRVTFWGVPGDPRHDPSRGWGCLEARFSAKPCIAANEESPPPLLTMPTSCTGPLRSDVETDSWENPGVFLPPFQ